MERYPEAIGASEGGVPAVREAETVAVRVVKVDAAGARWANDTLAVEEPLEIRLGFGAPGRRCTETISLTMRTPGDDEDLAAGFLLAEGIVTGRDQFYQLHSCGEIQEPGGYQNVVRAELQPEVEVDLGRLQRHFYTTSSCGVCGKTSLEALERALERALEVAVPPVAPDDAFAIDAELLSRLPETLRTVQEVFGLTGGLHAAALFDREGRLLCVREDVGRHNALDKLIGAQLRRGNLPLHERIILLSGRASFELLQKAIVAGGRMVAAVGAPSSLAVQLAERFGVTLVGWLRGGRCSIYTRPDRIRGAPEVELEMEQEPDTE